MLRELMNHPLFILGKNKKKLNRRLAVDFSYFSHTLYNRGCTIRAMQDFTTNFCHDIDCILRKLEITVRRIFINGLYVRFILQILESDSILDVVWCSIMGYVTVFNIFLGI